MQLVLLGLALAIFLHDSPPFTEHAARLPLPWLIAVVALPKLLLGGAYWLACARTYRKLGKPGAMRAIKRLNVFTALLPVLALAFFFGDLWAGALTSLRGLGPVGEMGPRDWILLDELAVMLPTLALLVWHWWAYYPIDRRMREAALLRRADEGLPLYPVWTRTQYVTTQLRNQTGLILGPLLMIMAWAETLVHLHAAGRIDQTQQLWLTPVGAGLVFLLAPLLIRRLWDTVPLPPGPVRDKLAGMCTRHSVKVRDLLLWRTSGGTINAAVMGLFGRLRFILLSDGLLDQVTEYEVEAVMAHELAHVRQKHLWWLLASAAAGVTALTLVGEAVANLPVDWPGWALPAAYGTGLALWALSFGWVSRRIERQADTFAARHMQGTFDEIQHTTSGDSVSSGVFGDRAVLTMVGALQRVADLNHIQPTRRSWRHGSIAWRQQYLRSLMGQPLGGTSVDRRVFWIKMVSLAVLVPVIGWEIASAWLSSG